MDQEMTFSLSYEQLTRFAEKTHPGMQSGQAVTYLCESAKAGAVLGSFWHELAINGYTSMNAIKRQEIIDADHQRPQKAHLAGG